MVETAAPAFAAWSPSPSPSTTSFGLGLAADRMAAERNETITYTIWLNVTGGGHLQLVASDLLWHPPAPPVLGSRIQFTVNVTNIIPTTVDPSDARNLTAYNVSIAIGISPFLDVGNGSWRSFPRTNLTPSENINVTFTAIVNANA